MRKQSPTQLRQPPLSREKAWGLLLPTCLQSPGTEGAWRCHPPNPLLL